MRFIKLIFKESEDALFKSHESQLRNKMKENLAVEPTYIDRIKRYLEREKQIIVILME